MSLYDLLLVREDENHFVYTPDFDGIHPSVLSSWLEDKYGKSNAMAYLIRETYIIYVKRSASDNSEMTPIPEDNATDATQKPDEIAPVEWGQILRDIEKAKEIYKKSAFSRSLVERVFGWP